MSKPSPSNCSTGEDSRWFCSAVMVFAWNVVITHSFATRRWTTRPRAPPSRCPRSRPSTRREQAGPPLAGPRASHRARPTARTTPGLRRRRPALPTPQVRVKRRTKLCTVLGSSPICPAHSCPKLGHASVQCSPVKRRRAHGAGRACSLRSDLCDQCTGVRVIKGPGIMPDGDDRASKRTSGLFGKVFGRCEHHQLSLVSKKVTSGPDARWHSTAGRCLHQSQVAIVVCMELHGGIKCRRVRCSRRLSYTSNSSL